MARGPRRRIIPLRRMAQNTVPQLQWMSTCPDGRSWGGDCTVVADIVDAGVSTAELRDARILEPGDVEYARGQAGSLR